MQLQDIDRRGGVGAEQPNSSLHVIAIAIDSSSGG